MSTIKTSENTLKDYSFDELDEINRTPPEVTDFDRIVDTVMNRRAMLRGGLAFGTAALVMGTTALTPLPVRASEKLAFTPVAANGLDTITVPDGFTWNIVATWGEPMWSSTPDFDHPTRGTAESQARAFGDNNDGMALFAHDGKLILAVNNEYTNLKITFGNRADAAPVTADDFRKGMMCHGISIVELARSGSGWSIVKDSAYNRRITPETRMEITGPARGHDLLKTSGDPTGTVSLGTWNNCGNGRTPWGTYLTCEENFNGYFSSSDEGLEISPEFKRYGIDHTDWGYGWANVDNRFDISKEPNEPNRAGYIVEIDPLDPDSTPKKRTAMGRFKHENAELVVNDDGHVVVYLGDDERGEFLYKFVTAGKYTAGGDNDDLLETGTLYVAKFDDAQTGKWMALTPETTGMSDAEIAIYTRMAASKVGATTMDRPEWVAAHPNKAEVYCALTNNKNRGKKPNAGGDLTPVGGPNPRAGNNYGQIVRWWPKGSDHTSEDFEWDLFVMAGNPTVHSDAYGGSDNVTPQNMFNSPDGLGFDSKGRLWIQTDGKYSNKDDFEGMGNNQMLVGDPETGEINRFLVGPKECEVTGITWSPDYRTLFVGIQHPGEKGDSHFPEGGNAVPRSAVIAISREDGQPIG